MNNLAIPASTTVATTAATFIPAAIQVLPNPSSWVSNDTGVLARYCPRISVLYTSGPSNGKTSFRLNVPRFYTETNTGLVKSNGVITIDVTASAPLDVLSTELELALTRALASVMLPEIKTALLERRPNF